MVYSGVSKKKGTIFEGVIIRTIRTIRTIVYWNLYWGPPHFGKLPFGRLIEKLPRPYFVGTCSLQSILRSSYLEGLRA